MQHNLPAGGSLAGGLPLSIKPSAQEYTDGRRQKEQKTDRDCR
jgi:hypothetical protein